MVIDPWNTAQLTENLRRRRIKVIEFNFSQQSVGRLAHRLYLLLREHALVLPNDPELLHELANVRIRESSPGLFRVDHDASGHDDRAVSFALAAEQLFSHPPHSVTRIRMSRFLRDGSGHIVGQRGEDPGSAAVHQDDASVTNAPPGDVAGIPEPAPPRRPARRPIPPRGLGVNGSRGNPNVGPAPDAAALAEVAKFDRLTRPPQRKDPS